MAKPTFSCWSCKEDSTYEQRADPGNIVFRKMDFSDHPEERDYYCTLCGKSNSIKLRESEWMMIEMKTRQPL